MKPLAYSWDGEGTAQSPYEIRNYDQLKELGDNVDWGKTFEGKYFQLMEDVDLKEKVWSSIGDNTNTFCGIFNGNGKVVSNMKLKNKRLSGLFGCLGSGEKGTGTITKLTVIGLEMEVDKETGVLGLLAGYNYGKINDCICQGNIQINRPDNVEPLYAGILVGVNQSAGSIENCTVKGQIQFVSDGAKQQNVGGVAGFNTVGASITGCVSEGTIIGKNRLAGICGMNSGVLKDEKNCGLMKMEALTLPAYLYPISPAGDGAKTGYYSVSVDKFGNNITINIGKRKETKMMEKDGVIYIKKGVPLYVSEGDSALFDGVIMEKGAYILIRGNVDFKTDSLEIVEKLESGVKAVESTAEAEDLCGTTPVEGADIVIMPKPTWYAQTADNGSDGIDGGSGGNGFVGGDGGSGGNGQTGENGLNGNGKLQVSIEIEDLCNDLVVASVSLAGQNGGKGGDGGKGGNGGIGEKNALEDKEALEKRPWNGKAGAGGNGGKGGDGGNGGDGNIIKVTYKTSNASHVYPKDEQLGKGGSEGAGGSAGKGGKDGKLGNSGKPGKMGSPGLIEIKVKDVD